MQQPFLKLNELNFDLTAEKFPCKGSSKEKKQVTIKITDHQIANCKQTNK